MLACEIKWISVHACRWVVFAALSQLQMCIHMYILYVCMCMVIRVAAYDAFLFYSNNRCFTDGINGLAKALQVNDTLKQLKVCLCVYVCVYVCVCVCACVRA